ncbi:MAG TPA: hypothetical protein VG488_10365, partial [Candidatus Angelobacter sp.]|nr:hypothetical protein [Candidatus Angelobacter sp.]
DDLSRMSEDYDLYLVQFDIGVVPYHGAKDHQAMVKLNFTERNVLAYELYPGASSYNIMRGQDKTNRLGISGAAQTLFGLGAAASFNHERNELHSGLSQSLFVAGFGAGSHQFGWLIGPAPYENFVNPGNRIVNALVLVPKTPNESNQKEQQRSITLKVTACWIAREQRYQWPWTSHSQDCSNQDADEKEVAITVALPRATTLTVQHIAYTPKELKETPGSDLNYDQQAKAAEPPKPEAGTGTQQAKANQQPKDSQETNTVLIQFKGTIDPNLTITAGNKIINRVRDVRGRAMFGGTDETLTGNADERAAISGSRFGLLEKDSLGPDTWLEVNAHSVLLNISKNTAGTDVFPVITLAEPGSSAGELSALMAENATIRVGEFTFGLENVPEKKLPESAYQPLFTERFGPGRIKVYVDSVDNAHPSSIRVISETLREGRSSRIWLHEQAQVVLVPEDTNPNSKVWPLKCYGDQGTLSCKIPVEQINKEFPTAFPRRFKVWVDEPPYFGRPGLWADDDLTQTETPTNNQPQTHWAPQPYSSGEWSDVRELSSPGSNGIADHWEARIKLWHVPSTGSSVPELRNSGQQLKTLIAAVPKDFEKSHLTGANLRMAQHQREGWRQAAQHAADQPEVITAKFTGDWLTLCIPFPAMPLLAQRLHVESTATTVAQPPNSSAANPANRPPVPCPAEPSGASLANSAPASSQTVELFVLPDLLPKVLPGPVKVTDLGNGGYRLEGEHLRAVQQVRLESPGPAILLDVSVGLNNVDFYATDLKPNMNYNVFVVIGNMTVPVIQEGDDKKLHQVRLLIPAPK